MTTIHLLGSEGFIGSALQREVGDFDLHCWSHRFEESTNYFNLLDSSSWQHLLNSKPTHVILLSWPGLPNYQKPFHVTRNLPACVELVEQLNSVGLQRIVVAGTCYEYGLQNGALREDQLTNPSNCYSIAKDSFRRVIETTFSPQGLQWCWARIFYPFGLGQNPSSFLPSLKRALDNGDSHFDMSSGRQLRDYVPIEYVARFLIHLACNPLANGVYNCGSGVPISLRELAENCITESSSSISLNFGSYPDRQDEPLAFWADTARRDSLIQ